MKLLSPHFEILPDAQKELWPGLAPCMNLGFVLYGGTAVALQLGHRSSVDFDFFSRRSLDGEQEKKMLQAMPFLVEATILQKSPETCVYRTPQGVRLSFFGNIRFGRVGSPWLTADGVLQVASLDDLLVMKLGTLLQRVEAKDYRDIAAMLRSGASLERGLAGAVALYGKQFPPSESVKAMTWFQGGDLDQLPETDRETLLSAARELQIHRLPDVRRISESLTLEA